MQVLSGALGRERVHYEAPPRDRLDAEMGRFLTWFNERKTPDNTLRACVAHLWFETLHPFEDGNGRIGRAIFDLALAPNDPEEGWLTAKRAARQTKVERVTASRDLSRLEELGVIEKDASVGGRSTRYRVRLGDAGPLRLVGDLIWS